MRKYIVMLLSVALLISLGGCTGAGLFVKSSKVADDAMDSISGLNVSLINSQLEVYKSSNQKGTTVTRLINLVETLNTTSMATNKIEISFLFDGTEDSIEEESTYSVDFEYNKETGYIQKVLIDKVTSDVQSGEENI